MFLYISLIYLLLRLTFSGSHVLNYDSVTICDGMEKVVRCPNKENIHVLQGFYGKWKNHDCNGIKDDPPNTQTCSKDRRKTTKQVREICQGQNQCTFIADKSIYGNPCPDTNAYLYITFFCMAPGKRIDHQRDKFNHEVVTVATHGYLVSEKRYVPEASNIIGLLDSEASKDRTFTVEHSNTIEKQALERKLVIPIAKDDNIDSHEEKYTLHSRMLDVVHRNKIPDKIPELGPTIETTRVIDQKGKKKGPVLNYDSVTICDGMEKVVRCPNNEVIHILQGFYGKWKHRDCHGIKVDLTNNRTCNEERNRTTADVRKSCQGQNQCTFISDKTYFGNPCPDSEPYLYITFFCLSKGINVEGVKKNKNDDIVTVLTHGYLVSENRHRGEREKSPHISHSDEKNFLNKEAFGELPMIKAGRTFKTEHSHESFIIPVHDDRQKIHHSLMHENETEEEKVRRDDINEHDRRSSTICNGQSKLVACLNGKGLKIESAFYGKRTGQDCNGDLPYKDESPSCSIQDAKTTINDSCNGRQTCLLFADENMYGKHSCQNVNKYLHIEYMCFPISQLEYNLQKKKEPEEITARVEEGVSRTTKPDGQRNLTVMVCNGERHTISCQRDVGMRIINAFYGKRNGIDCRGDIAYRDDIPDCVNPRALDSVKFLCENRKSCELVSEKEFFGDDVCTGVNKYLEVAYQC